MNSSDVVKSLETAVLTPSAPKPQVTPVGRQSLPQGGNVSSLAATEKTSTEEVSKTVADAVANIADFVQSVSRQLQFSVDESYGGTIITVVDRDTEEVVRQIPSEEVVRLAKYIDENAPDLVKGLLVNNEA